MTLTSRFTRFFAKNETNNVLGLSLCQTSLLLCHVEQQGRTQCHTIPASNNDYSTGIGLLKTEHEYSGESHVVLSSKHNQMVQVDKPNVPEEELNQALKWQIKDLVNIPTEDMVIDYFDGPVLAGGAEKINVVCANKQLLIPIIEKLNKENLNIATITIEEFAFASLIPIKEEACLLLCQQPNEDMLLLVIKEGKLYFQRRLRGLSEISTRSEDELSMGPIDTLSLEIQRSTDYFERQLKQAPIKSIEILVPIEKEAFLARKLAENSNVPVNLLTLPESFNQERSFAACLGATQLHHMGSN